MLAALEAADVDAVLGTSSTSRATTSETLKAWLYITRKSKPTPSEALAAAPKRAKIERVDNHKSEQSRKLFTTALGRIPSPGGNVVAIAKET